jgi:hypothetical protein
MLGFFKKYIRISVAFQVFSINSVKMNVSRLMEDSSDSEYDVDAVANEAIANILPKKSRPQYEKAYTKFPGLV